MNFKSIVLSHEKVLFRPVSSGDEKFQSRIIKCPCDSLEPAVSPTNNSKCCLLPKIRASLLVYNVIVFPSQIKFGNSYL